MGYTKNALSGFSWQTMLKFAIAGTTLVKISILARLLSPEIFGVFSIITIALGISEATTQTGVNVTIVQSKRSMQYFVDTAWVISIIRGLIIGILMVLLGAGLARLYDNPDLLIYVGIASMIPVVKGFINPSIVMMQKKLAFFADATYRFSLVAIDGLLAIVLALFVKSVVALLAAMIGAAIFEVVVSFFFFKTRPRFHYVRSSGELILRNAKWLSFAALFSYLLENLDNLIIGKLTSAFGLGIYHNAYGMSHKVNYDFAKSATHSTFPIFAKLVDDKARALRAFVKSSAATIGLVAATSLPLFLFPEFFVNIILGTQWQEAIPLVRWLVMAGVLQSIISLIYNFLIARKSYLPVNIHLALSLVVMVVLLLALTPSSGLLGAVVAIFVSRLVVLPILLTGFAVHMGWTDRLVSFISK